MNFSFNETAGVIASGVQKLKANAIHEVTFDGVEAINDVAFKNGEKGNVLDIKFTNESGYYTLRVFELRPEDMQDKDNQWGGKNPSKFKATMLTLKHLIDAVNPELGEKIDKKEKDFGASSWDGLRKFMVEATKNSVGNKTFIKLIADKDGYGVFPFAAAYTKENKLYMPSRFIGENLSFTPKEVQKMKTAATATPTPVGDNSFTEAAQAAVPADLDFNL